MKKIVILGAGIYQVPLIKAAKEKGLYVIVASIPGNYPGFALADKVYYINTTDKEAVLEMAKNENIAAIVTTGTDVAMSTIGYVCDRMGLPGISLEASRIVTDKALMKEAFFEHKVKTASFKRVRSLDEVVEAFEEIKAPAILKIVDKSGSRGISRIDSVEDIERAYTYASEATNADYMILESFISGKEIGVDAFIQKGEIKLIVPHDKLVYTTKRTGIPMGHICPISASDELNEAINTEVIKAIRATGLDNCAVNVDAFVTDNNEIYIIEIAGRCGATGIPEVISGYMGVDYYDAIIDNALGKAVEFPKYPMGKPTASVLLHADKTGVLEEIRYKCFKQEYVNEACDIEKSASVNLDYAPGELVHEFENGTHRIGQAVFSEDTIEEVLKQIDIFNKNLCVRVTKEDK